MSRFSTPKVREDNGEFYKQFPDRGSYRSELLVLQGIQGATIAPELLGHDDQTMTLRLGHAGRELLALLINDERAFNISHIHRVMGGLLKGLCDLHEKDLCHYDVTPRNVCLHGDLDGDFSVKLIDYGLSYSLNKIPKSHRSQRVGTPSCLSPEHLAMTPELGKAADVFCAGLTMMQLIGGGSDVISMSLGKLEPQVREAHLNVPTMTAWGEKVPGEMQLLLRTMLDPDPTYRRSDLCYALLGGAG